MGRSLFIQFSKYVSLNILGTIGFSCYILADTFFISAGMGTSGLAALNLVLPVFGLIMSIAMLISTGGSTRFSLSRSPQIFSQSILYVLLASCPFILAGLFFTPSLAHLLGADSTIIDSCSIYLKTILLFSPGFLLNAVLQAFMRNDSRPVLAMHAMLWGSLSNIILDYILIFPCQMGMLGAALATGSSPVVGLAIMSAHFIQKRNSFHWHFCRPRFNAMTDISALGSGSFVTELSSCITILVYNLVILRLAGNTGVAAYGIIANIALVVMSIFLGLSQGLQPLISRETATGNLRGVKTLARYGFTTSLSISLLICLSTFFFADSIVSLFNSDHNPLLATLAGDGMRIYFTAFIFAGLNITASTCLSSIDRPRPAFLISILRGFVILIPVLLLFSQIWGVRGVWVSMTVSELLVLIFATTAIHRNMA